MALNSIAPNQRFWQSYHAIAKSCCAAVKVFISHGVNLANRLTFWLGPRECFEHSRGLLILPQVAH